jgi:putative transposase
MPRQRRIAPDGFVHHVINRGDHRETIFRKPQDFRAFLAVTAEAATRIPMRILAYCVMRNHFHLVLWPYHGHELSAYMQLLMNRHLRRYLVHYPPPSPGHVYQGRYLNSLVQASADLLRLMRYVEANPVAAGIVPRAELYKWSSASRHARDPGRPILHEGPLPKPADWLDLVNTRLAPDLHARIRKAVQRGAPVGDAHWMQQVVTTYGLEHTVRDAGRPRVYEVLSAADQ